MKFKIFISRNGHKEKPTEKESRSMNYNREQAIKNISLGNWKPHEVDLDYIAKKLGEGHSINASITDTTRLMILDIDNGITEKAFTELLKKEDMIPNIYYRTFSYNKELGKYKMRCIYILDRDYTKEEYKELYRKLVEIFPKYTTVEGKEQSILDTSMSNFKQLVHGTNKQVKIIHYKPFKANEKLGYINTPKKVETYVKTNITKNYTHSNNELTLNGIIDHFNLNNLGLLGYTEGLNYYLAVREFDLESLLQFQEKYIPKYEQAYKKGYKCEKGSIASKLYGALNKLYNA